MRVAFRADAEHEMGTGHIFRCLTLADELATAGDHCFFICRALPEPLLRRLRGHGHDLLILPPSVTSFAEHSCDVFHAAWLGATWEEDAQATRKSLAACGGADWLVVDHYALDRRWESVLAADVAKIMVIDDLADRPHQCAILLDQNFFTRPEQRYQSLVPSSCRLLLGPGYALLRDEFLSLRKQGIRQRRAVERILVFLGGTDPENFTVVAMEALRRLESRIRTDLVIGSGHRQREAIAALCAADQRFHFHCDVDCIAELMNAADLAVGAGGTSSWERLCMGLPSVVVSLGANQAPVNASLAESGLIRLLGPATGVTATMVASAITALQREPLVLARMSEAAMRLVDGNGARRVAEAMRNGIFSLRLACQDDAEDLLEWRNDTTTCQYSRNTEPVGREDHLIWFSSMLQNPNSRLLVGTIGSDKVGTVRLDRLDPDAPRYRVSITVNPARRGLGIGRVLLRAACKSNAPCAVVAEIKDGNAVSERLFHACGFRFEGHDARLQQSLYTADFSA